MRGERHGGLRGGRRHRGTRAPRRATWTTALAGLLTLGLLTSCAGGGDAAPEPTSDGGGEIIVASGLDVTGEDGIRQQLIEEWNRHSDQHARLVELPRDADQQRSQLLGALQSGSARYDVVNLDVTWVPEFAEAGLISRLDDDLLDEDVIPSVARTGVWRGHTYAVPFNSDVGLLYYRPDVLRDAGVEPADLPRSGTTWPELYAMMRRVADDEDRAVADSGWTGQLDTYEGLTVTAVEAFASIGVSLTDADGRYSADPESLEEGLNELEDRVEHAAEGAESSREYESLNDFARGRTAFLRHWPYAYQQLRQSLDEDDGLGVAPLPGKAVLGGQNLAVAANSPRARAAVALIRFLTSRESQQCLLDAGLPAVRTSVYQGQARCRLPEPATEASASPDQGEGADTALSARERDTYNRMLLTALELAVQRPRTPYYGAFTQALQQGVRTWLDRPRPKGDVAEQLDAQLRRALSGR